MERVQEALEQLRKETRTDKNLMAAIKFFMEGEEARKALREVEDRLDAMRLSNLALRKEVATVRLANSVDFDDVVSLESERTKEIKTVMISEVPKGKERLVDKVLSPEHAISEGLLGASVGERIVLDSRVEYRVMQITKEQQGFFIEVLQ
jgi:transcription elongation GreA/GreB family factor